MKKLTSYRNLLLGVAVFAVLFAGSFTPSKAEADSDNDGEKNCAVSLTLRMGDEGKDVVCLQKKIGTKADGKFGKKTWAALRSWQVMNGLLADGVAGPLTLSNLGAWGSKSGNFPLGCRSASGYSEVTGLPCYAVPSARTSGLAAGCTSTSGYSPVTGLKCDKYISEDLPAGCLPGFPYSTTTGKRCFSSGTNNDDLSGGSGSIEISPLSTYEDETVGEGDNDAKVLAFEVEADDESDVRIISMKVELNQQDGSASEEIDDYMDSVSVWMGSKRVAEVDAEDFSESSGNIWTKTISLNNAIIDAGDTEKFYLAVTAASNIDSNDMDSDDWQIGVSSVRFIDGDGETTTESLDLEVDDGDVDDDVEESFDFDENGGSSSGDLELRVALNSDDDEINESHDIDVESGSLETEDVEILSFTLKAIGSDITVNEIPVTFTTTGDSNESNLILAAHLIWNGDEIDTVDVPNGGEVVFNNLDIDINEGDTEELLVTIDLASLNGALDEGDTVKAGITSALVDDIEAEDSDGDTLDSSELTGSAVGEASTVQD